MLMFADSVGSVIGEVGPWNIDPFNRKMAN